MKPLVQKGNQTKWANRQNSGGRPPNAAIHANKRENQRTKSSSCARSFHPCSTSPLQRQLLSYRCRTIFF